MKFNKFGYWITNDIIKPFSEISEEDSEPDAEIFSDDPEVVERLKKWNEPKPLHGRCVIMIRFERQEEYDRWKKYFGQSQKWEFVTSFPAIMRTECEFENSLQVEVIAKKIVQLLENGFDVHSANWNLESSYIVEHVDDDDEGVIDDD